MPAIMADHDVEGHLQVLLRILTSAEWGELWSELAYTVESFVSLDIPYSMTDLELWHTCQTRQIVLITGNRNKAGLDSLTSAIQQFISSSSIPETDQGRNA